MRLLYHKIVKTAILLSRIAVKWRRERDSFLIFARRFGYYLLLRRAKIFGHRSQNNALCCFVHCVRIPVYILTKKQESTLKRGCFSLFGGERGIRTLVCLRTNWFRVSPVMTTSISLHNCDAQVCITIMELDETRLNELAHWIHFAFATRRSGSLLTRRRVSESSP